MVFRNLRTGRLVSANNPDTIEMMQGLGTYEAYVPQPAPEPAPAPKPKPAKKKTSTAKK